MDEKFLKLLGTAVHNFSALEFLIKALVSRLISENQKVGSIVTAQMSFRNLIDAFASLMRFQHSEKIIDDLIKKLSQDEERRNEIIHSVYLCDSPEIQQVTTRIKVTSQRKKGLNYTIKKIPSEDLKKFSNDFLSRVLEIQRLYESLFPNETPGI